MAGGANSAAERYAGFRGDSDYYKQIQEYLNKFPFVEESLSYLPRNYEVVERYCSLYSKLGELAEEIKEGEEGEERLAISDNELPAFLFELCENSLIHLPKEVEWEITRDESTDSFSLRFFPGGNKMSFLFAPGDRNRDLCVSLEVDNVFPERQRKAPKAERKYNKIHMVDDRETVEARNRLEESLVVLKTTPWLDQS